MTLLSESSVKPSTRRRRYNLLSFQTRYAVAFIVLSAFITAAVAFLTFAVFNGIEIEGSFDANIKWFVGGLVVLVLGSSVIFYALVIVASHRVAGPLTLLSQYMHDIENARSPQIRDLRKRDELKEFYAGFRRMIDAISKRESAELVILSRVLENLSQNCDAETKADLSKLISEKSLRNKT